ncbi:MAG TPA: hypothetical protein PKD31_11650 [Blastocatellia bacterium]|nr:hypothetical protein [Blastocatellia bacterium]
MENIGMDGRGKMDWKFFGGWTCLTAAGWALGIPLIAAMALLGEALGIGGIQVLVGLGMGAGIGWTQGRVMRRLMLRFWPWFWSCVIGLGLPFLAVDLAKLAHRDFPYYPYSCVALGGLLVGLRQAALLRPSFQKAGWQKAGWWVAGSVLGWSLAASLVGVADALFRSHSIRGVVGLIVYLGSLVGGGLLLGIVTGAVLVWLRAQKTVVSPFA